MDQTHLSSSSEFSVASSLHHQEPTSYIPIRVLGKGAFGEAVLYRKTEDNTLVVWKEVFLGRLDEKGRRDAQNEVDILAMLDHSNVVSYYNHFVDGDTLLIEMEYANAGSLYHWLGRRDTWDLLPEQDVLWYLYQLTSGLVYLHGLAILHRDIKTLNIFLTKSSLVKLGDFGIAKILSGEIKEAETCVGTPYYMSPEMMRGGPYNHKSDIWATGCVLHELLTNGKRTFDATNPLKLSYQVVHGEFGDIDSGYSKDMHQLLEVLLSKNSQDRPDAKEMLQYPVFKKDENRLTGFENRVNDLHAANSQSHRPNSGGAEASCVLPIITSQTTEVFCWGSGRSNPGKIEHFVSERGAVKVAVGVKHFAVITVEKELYTWATLHGHAASSGQLGHGDKSSCRNPKRVEALVGLAVLDVGCGEEFTVCIVEDGRVYTWGSNYSSCLGLKELKEITLPTTVPIFSQNGFRATHLACGDNHVVVLTENGDVYTWGSGEFGRLGLDDEEEDHSSPQKVLLPVPEPLANVFAGPDCTFVVTVAGKVLACGNNEHNKLGFNNAVVGLGKKQREITYDIPCVHQLKLVKPLSHYAVRFVSSGKTHSAVIDNLNQLFLFGSNRFGQLGIGDYKAHGGIVRPSRHLAGKRFNTIACGDGFTITGTNNNEVYSWGKGDNGQLGFDIGTQGSGPGGKCSPYPKAIFSALHCTADLAVSHWTVLIIAEQVLQTRMVHSGSMRFISSSSANTTGVDNETPHDDSKSSDIFLNVSRNDIFDKSRTLSTVSGSAVPDWLKDELNNASIIPLYEPNQNQKNDNITQPQEGIPNMESSIECECGCRDIISMLHKRIEELENSNVNLRNVMSESGR